MDKDQKPLVSIIIPTYNSEKTLQRCLESVYHSEYKPFEVIAVDDGSTDSSLEIARKFPARVIKLDRHRGCDTARNRGARETRGEILFFVDSDVLLEPRTLTKAVETFAERPGIWATFGCYSKESPSPNFFSVYKNLLHHYTHQTASEEAGTFWTACGAIKRDIFERLGGFDEDPNYHPIGDIAFGYKVSKHGGKIYLNKQLQVRHLKTYTFFSLIKLDFTQRAVPWTEIILKERFFRSDLNLKTSNIFSAIVVFITGLTLFAALSINGFINLWLILLLVGGFLLLNGRFFRFILREKGPLFLLGAILMNFLFYLYSGIGFLTGVARYIWNDLIMRKNLKIEKI